MKRLLYAAVLAIVVGVIFAPTALAQNATCADFNGDQAAAQRALPQNPQLDRNKDGIACNDLLRQGQQPAAPQVTPQDAQQQATPQPADQGQQQPTTPQPAPSPQAEATGQLMEAGGNLPATGGPALLLPAATLLVGSGLLVVAVKRRG